MKTENRILSRGRTSGGDLPEGQATRSPFPPNAKARWEAISRALLDQGYAIVSDGDVSRIVRERRGETGTQGSLETDRKGPVFGQQTDQGGSK